MTFPTGGKLVPLLHRIFTFFEKHRFLICDTESINVLEHNAFRAERKSLASVHRRATWVVLSAPRAGA